jgi:DNA modification methylase
MNLSDSEKQRIIALIQNGEKLPKEFIYKLFADDEDVFLFWNGRKEAVTNVVLPFHSIEHIDEPRKEKERSGDAIGFFDTRGRQLQGWTNKLIWGDNKLILSSLANGALREDIEREGGLKLIYIDPPFAVGADFGFNIEIGGETAEKKQSVIEEIAYRDTWGKGISSYLSMMYERLKLMHSLLAEDGSMYVHCDWRVSSYLRMILDDIFGDTNLVNELIWKRTNVHSHAAQGTKHYSRIQDTLLFYGKTESYIWNQPYGEHNEEHIISSYKNIEEETGRRYSLGDLTATDGGNKGNPRFEFLGVTRYWRYNREKMEELFKQNRIVQTSANSVPRQKRYLDESKGLEIGSLWIDINPVQAQAIERLSYPTQKPEALLERIIKASSNEGDLVADFFCGSGTTAAVAEKLGRQWITTDLGRFAVHTARKRLIGVQRELQAGGKDFRAFEVLNLGKYERQFFINTLTDANAEATREAKSELYVNLILEAYKAKRAEGYGTLHGTKAGRVVHVGPLDVPVTQALVQEVFEECRKLLITEVDILGVDTSKIVEVRVK